MVRYQSRERERPVRVALATGAASRVCVSARSSGVRDQKSEIRSQGPDQALTKKFGVWYDDSSYPEILMRTKIAITLDQSLLTRLDRLVRERRFPNRSRALQEALEDKLQRVDRSRLARECAKLDPRFEQQLADEGLDLDQWPEY